MLECVACRRAPAAAGVLCEDCAVAVSGMSALCQEQIVDRIENGTDAAALVDRWGTVHRMASTTPIGRHVPGSGLAIAEGSMSRRHAEIVQLEGRWHVRDLGSSNGTLVNEVPVTGTVPLRGGDMIFFGQVGFYFVAPAPSLAHPPSTSTERPRPPAAHGLPRMGDADADADAEHETFMGLPTADLTLASPSGGGSAVLQIDHRSQQISRAQHELLLHLVQRMVEERGADERVRGFVRSSELMAHLSWDTAHPDENHLKQLVRRTRRALVRAGMGDLVESRQGFGYRLRLDPRRLTIR